uniref:Uncharacterized protein n=1 Tax=Melanothamnus harveyi TaxID=397005 RepID=A0A1Z1MH03_MELHR|nr:hypothetical protein [Melanothamnus harveyi]ARW65350.1 hypothetical protein [Melanothamnus harveyi]
MPNYKLITSLTPSIYLIMLPYRYKESLFFLVIFTILNKNKKVLYYKVLKNIKRISIFYACIILGLVYFDHPDSKINNILTNFVIFPYFLSLNYNMVKTITCKLSIYCIVFEISSYLIKGLMINAIHLIITSHLFLFTKNEVLLSNINLLNQKSNLNRKKINNLRQISLHILSSYEMFEVILNKFYYIYIGIKCKNETSFKSYISYLNHFLNNIWGHITGEIYLSIVNLWTRY